jgi:hypothetical protein
MLIYPSYLAKRLALAFDLIRGGLTKGFFKAGAGEMTASAASTCLTVGAIITVLFGSSKACILIIK